MVLLSPTYAMQILIDNESIESVENFSKLSIYLNLLRSKADEFTDAGLEQKQRPWQKLLLSPIKPKNTVVCNRQ